MNTNGSEMLSSPEGWSEDGTRHTRPLWWWEAEIPERADAARRTAFYEWYEELEQNLDLPEQERPKWADYRRFLLGCLEEVK